MPTWTEADKQAMDDAAIDAQDDLSNYLSDDKAFQVVADWWAKWVMKAGHKRLGRILLQYKSKGTKVDKVTE